MCTDAEGRAFRRGTTVQQLLSLSFPHIALVRSLVGRGSDHQAEMHVCSESQIQSFLSEYSDLEGGRPVSMLLTHSCSYLVSLCSMPCTSGLEEGKGPNLGSSSLVFPLPQPSDFVPILAHTAEFLGYVGEGMPLIACARGFDPAPLSSVFQHIHVLWSTSQSRLTAREALVEITQLLIKEAGTSCFVPSLCASVVVCLEACVYDTSFEKQPVLLRSISLCVASFISGLLDHCRSEKVEMVDATLTDAPSKVRQQWDRVVGDWDSLDTIHTFIQRLLALIASCVRRLDSHTDECHDVQQTLAKSFAHWIKLLERSVGEPDSISLVLCTPRVPPQFRACWKRVVEKLVSIQEEIPLPVVLAHFIGKPSLVDIDTAPSKTCFIPSVSALGVHKEDPQCEEELRSLKDALRRNRPVLQTILDSHDSTYSLSLLFVLNALPAPSCLPWFFFVTLVSIDSSSFLMCSSSSPYSDEHVVLVRTVVLRLYHIASNLNASHEERELSAECLGLFGPLSTTAVSENQLSFSEVVGEMARSMKKSSFSGPGLSLRLQYDMCELLAACLSPRSEPALRKLSTIALACIISRMPKLCDALDPLTTVVVAPHVAQVRVLLPRCLLSSPSTAHLFFFFLCQIQYPFS